MEILLFVDFSSIFQTYFAIICVRQTKFLASTFYQIVQISCNDSDSTLSSDILNFIWRWLGHSSLFQILSASDRAFWDCSARTWVRVGNAEWPGQAIELGPVVKRQEKNRGHLQGVSKECFCIYGFFSTPCTKIKTSEPHL